MLLYILLFEYFFLFYLSFCHLLKFSIDNQYITGCRCMVADSLSVTPCFALFSSRQNSSDLLPVAELLVQAPRTVSSKSVNRFWTCLEHLLMVDEVGRWQLMTDGWQMKRISATRNLLNTNFISVKGGKMTNKAWQQKLYRRETLSVLYLDKMDSIPIVIV